VADPCKMHPPASTVLWRHTNIPCSMAHGDMFCQSRNPGLSAEDRRWGEP
jgi:hypothetical protein